MNRRRRAVAITSVSCANGRPSTIIVDMLDSKVARYTRLPRVRCLKPVGREGYTTVAFTQWIGGSDSNTQLHSSPPSRPIHNCPVVVPK